MNAAKGLARQSRGVKGGAVASKGQRKLDEEVGEAMARKRAILSLGKYQREVMALEDKIRAAEAKMARYDSDIPLGIPATPGEPHTSLTLAPPC